MTRLGDRSYPGSPANLLQRTVFDPVESAAELESVMLDVSEDSEKQSGDE